MKKNYFKTAIRNLQRNKSYAAINMPGPAIGIGTCLLIFLAGRFETSFDNFHSKKKAIIGSVIIAWITVGHRAIKAAVSNPVKI